MNTHGRYEFKLNTSYKDDSGNYYCRVLGCVRNVEKGQSICNAGCPCYAVENAGVAEQCGYYMTDFKENIKKADEYEIFIKNLIEEGKIPFFPEVKNISKRLYSAYAFAAYAHRNQKRKGTGIPYLSHLISAVEIAKSITEDEDILIAVLLHDTLEDTDVTYGMIKENFGENVAKMVAHETEDKRRERPASDTWKERKQENIENVRNSSKEIKIIALCDKLSNLRSIYYDVCTIGEETWKKFNQKDKLEHRWYYTKFMTVFEDLKDTKAYKEYKELLEKVW